MLQPCPRAPRPCCLICGDFDSWGKLEAWLTQEPQKSYPHKVVICGNHDSTFKKLDGVECGDGAVALYDCALERSLARQKDIKGFRKGSLIESAVLLHDRAVDITDAAGQRLRIYGTPYQKFLQTQPAL